jgi:hydroxymethylbilane synthase
MRRSIRIGTRGSKLALWQAEWVKKALLEKYPDLIVELVIIKTKGDKILDVPLAKVGGKGLFVKEIEAALLDHRIDLAVHSMKDMPAEIPAGLVIGAVPLREAPQDILISRSGQKFIDLPKGALIGTSSLRRAAQLRHNRPDITIADLRGNLDTRIKKLDQKYYDAIVLAAAGMKRLGFEGRISQILDMDIMLPAVGQGALCIEIRAKDPDIESIVGTLDHRQTHIAIKAERAFLHQLEGGCQVPIAAHAIVTDNLVSITGLVARLDGSVLIKATQTGKIEHAANVGIGLAKELLDQGAGPILENLKNKCEMKP